MKSRKALSEMVASMVILVIVSVLGVVLYNLSLSTINTQQENLLLDIGMEEGIAQERFEIVGVTRTSSNKMNITYLNYGEVDIRIADVYIGTERLALPEQAPCSKLKVRYILITPSYFPEEVKILYKVRIVSERGVTTDASIYL